MIKQTYQGDILFLKGVELPQNIIFKQLKKDVIIEEGEVTGHFHTLKPVTKEAEISYTNFLDSWYFEINKGQAVVTHPEHKEIVLDKGVYYIGKQYEYDEQEKYRQVQD